MDTNYLDLLINIIIDNANLSYTDDKLRIDNDDTIMQVIRVIAKDKYENRLEDLKNKKINSKEQ